MVLSGNLVLDDGKTVSPIKEFGDDKEFCKSSVYWFYPKFDFKFYPEYPVHPVNLLFVSSVPLWQKLLHASIVTGFSSICFNSAKNFAAYAPSRSRWSAERVIRIILLTVT